MRHHNPLIRSLKIIWGEDAISVVMDDAEYGETTWREEDNGDGMQLYAAGGGLGVEYTLVERHRDEDFPPGGDAAMSLENDMYDIVSAAFVWVNGLPETEDRVNAAGRIHDDLNDLLGCAYRLISDAKQLKIVDPDETWHWTSPL